MALRKYKPTSPGRRFMTSSTFDDVTRSEPEKSLVEPLTKKGGRNVYGRVTTRHRGVLGRVRGRRPRTLPASFRCLVFAAPARGLFGR